MAYSLRWYQQDSIKGIYDYFTKNNGNPLIVVPTGGGKSIIIAEFIKQIIPLNQRVLMVTHVKELIEQNAEKFDSLCDIPYGIYSAGIGRRDIRFPVLFAGIGSIFKRAEELGKFDLVIVDECHLITNEKDTGMYQQFIREAQEINPKLKVIGFTATPYRMKGGLLTEGKHRIFTDIAYECDLLRLIEDGYLSAITTRCGEHVIDTSGLKVSGGEFTTKSMEEAVHKDNVTEKALDDIMSQAQKADKKSWLVFCASVAHAYECRDYLRSKGITCETVEAKTPKEQRKEYLEKFKNGELQCITNKDVLTTGFDAPNLDLLALLRPTKSAGLFVQIAGRLLRVPPELFSTPSQERPKKLLLDYASNVERFGCLDQIKPRKAGSKRKGEAPVKKCPACQSYMHPSVMTCEDCGHVFPKREIEVARKASELAILSNQHVEPEWLEVKHVIHRKHQKPGKPPSLRVDYTTKGLQTFSEWICFEHEGYARRKAEQWWKERDATPVDIPDTVFQAINSQSNLKQPTKIQVKKNGKYDEIIGYQFDGEAERTG